MLLLSKLDIASSPYYEALGCSGNTSGESAELNDAQCLIMQVGLIYLLVFGVFGCIVHAYIVFSYNFRVDEDRHPVQTLILCLSVFDFLGCSFLVATWFISHYNVINQSFTCSIFITFSSIDRNTIYAVVLLLAANRYYSICKPPQDYIYFFANRRIKIYMSVIFIAGFSVSFLNQIYYCYLENNSSLPYQLFNGLIVGSYNVTTLLFILYFYTNIARKLSERIRENERLNQIAIKIAKDSDESSSDSDSNKGEEYLRNVFDYDLKVERSYLKAITASVFIALPLLVLQLVFSIWACAEGFEGPDLFTGSGDKTLVVGNVVMLDLFSTLFILNPIIFYFTNEDFKIKLNRPLREIRKVLSRNKNNFSEF